MRYKKVNRDLIQKDFVERQNQATRQADEMWDRVFSKALNGEINKEEIITAMEICNSIDKSII